MKTFFVCFFTVFLTNYSIACRCNTPLLTREILLGYKYVSVVKVKKLSSFEVADKSMGYYQLAEVESLEIFKGGVISEVLISSVNTSCDMGVKEGECWIILANDWNGYPTLFPCGYNQQFLSSDISGLYFSWFYLSGISTLNFLRNVFTKLPKNGKYDGKWMNGKPSFSLKRENGKITGNQIMYDENGKKVINYSFKDSLLNGVKTIWYKNGQVHSFSNYKNDTLNGISAEFSVMGVKTSETNYSKGVFNGLRQEWDESGNLISTGNYVYGKPKDSIVNWYPVYSTVALARLDPLIMFENVSVDSAFKWSQRKQLESLSIYDSIGNLLHEFSYYLNGNLREETIFEPNSKQYILHEYHFNGITKKFMIYWIAGKDKYGSDDIRYLFEETCFGDDGKRIRKHFFDAEGKKVIKAIDLENGKEKIVFPRQ